MPSPRPPGRRPRPRARPRRHRRRGLGGRGGDPAAAGVRGGSADALNLLAFATRHLGDLDRAASYYRAALGIEPDHLGALEYQGQLFLLQGDREGAERNLARLTHLCGTCEERETLAAALAGEDRGGY